MMNMHANRLFCLFLLILFPCFLAVAQQPVLRMVKPPTATNVTDRSVTITWETNAEGSNMVLYGTDQAQVQALQNQAWPKTTTPPSGSKPGYRGMPWGGMQHSVTIENLKPNTTYYYAARSSSGRGSGGMTTSDVLSFTTAAPGSAASTSPTASTGSKLQIVIQPQAHVCGNTAFITWDTNAEASNMVLYGTDQAQVRALQSQAWPKTTTPPSGSTPGYRGMPWGDTHHVVDLQNLQPNTTYYFMVRSTSGRGTGTMTTSDVNTFSSK
jgi:hypothetical protein